MPFQPGEAEQLNITVEDVAGNKKEETLPLYPYITGTGAEAYVPNAEAVVAGQTTRINLTTGNGMQSFKAFTQEGPGIDLDIFLTYNHQNRVKGQLGYGWNFSLDSRLNKWVDGNITWQGFDGTVYWFKPEDGGYATYANGQRQHFPKLTLDPIEGNPENTDVFIMEWPDQLLYRFYEDGRFWLVQDRHVNGLHVRWEQWRNYHGLEYRIKKAEDTNNHEVEFGYDEATGDLKSTIITDLNGIGSQTGSPKRKLFFMYNQKGDFVGYREPSQKMTRFVYDDLHRITKVIDNGNNEREQEGETDESVTTLWTYDDHNRVTRMSAMRKQDHVEEFVGAEYGTRQATVLNPLGKYTLRWNDADRLTEKVEQVDTPDGTAEAKTSFEYSANNLVRSVDALNREVRYRYDDFDNIIAQQSASGRIMRYTYNDLHDLVSETGPLGYNAEYEYTYDPDHPRRFWSRKTTQVVVHPAGVNDEQTLITEEHFNDKGLLEKRIDANGNTFDYTYDETGFLTSDGTRVSYENDLHGNVLRETTDAGTPDEAVTSSQFNEVSWLLHREGPTGLVEDYEYDPWGRVTKAVQKDKNDESQSITRTYKYDDGGNLIEESDGLTKTTYKLDGMGNVLSKVTIPLEEDTAGKLEESYLYDSRGLLVKQTDSRGETKETQYNKAGQHVKTIVTPGNYATTIEYDDAGRQKAVIAADGGRTEYVYDLLDRIVEQKQFVKPVFPSNISISANGISEQAAVTTNRYDSAGRLIEEKRPNDSWMRYVYDGIGQVLEASVGGPIPQWNGTPLASGSADSLYEGHETLQKQQYSFDKLGRMLSFTDGNDDKTEYRYTGRTVETMTPALDETGKSVVYTRKESFDPAGHLILAVSESDEESTTTYDAFGHEVKSVKEEGQVIETKTDAYGRVSERIEAVDQSGAVQKFLYKVDAWGNMLEERRQLNDSEWATTTYRYSPEGDLEQQTSSTGLVTEYAYDEHGLLKQITEQNALGNGSIEVRVTAYSYDSMGRQIKVVQPDGGQQQTVYDTLGNQVLSFDALNNITEYRYDLAGQTTDIINYKEGTADLSSGNISALIHYVYDGSGNVVLEKDPNGNIIRSVFDAGSNLLQEIHYANPSMSGDQIVNDYKYDPRGLMVASVDGNGHATTYAYDTEGQQTMQTDPVGQWVKFEYSDAGFVTAERRPLARDTEWLYDYRGNMTQEKDALGHIQRFSLDLDGRMETQFNRLGEATQYGYDTVGHMTHKQTPSEGIFSYRYDSAGNKLEEDRPVYGAVRYDYDTRDSLTSVIEPQAAVGELKTDYTYDAELNRTSQKDGNSQTTNYDYDELGRRLQKVVVRGESGQDVFEYQYDPNGNVVFESKPGGLTTRYQYDYMNRKTREDFNDGTWYAYTFDNAGNMLTRTDKNGTIEYDYYDNNQLKQTTYPNGDTVVVEYNENGEKVAETINGERTEFELDASGRPKSYTDSKGYKYEYQYDADGYVKSIQYPNGTVTSVDYKPGHLIGTQKTTKVDVPLHSSVYDYNAREFITGVQDEGHSSGYAYNDREQLSRVETVDGDVMLYEYDGAGNRIVRKTIIQGTKEDLQKVITTDELVEMVLASFGMKKPKPKDPSEPGEAPVCGPKDKGNNGNANGHDKDNGNGNGNGKDKSAATPSVKVAAPTTDLIAKNDNSNGGGNGNDNAGGNGNGGGNVGGADSGNAGGNGGDGNGNGHGNGHDKGNGNGNGNGNGGASGDCSKGWQKALEKGNGKKLGLWKKLGEQFGDIDIETMFETGQIEHILAAIDNIVNGEVNLPPGGHDKLFERIREVGKGYTIIGTNYKYNDRNQLVHRENLIRYEDYDYEYDDQGNLLTDGRSKFVWNALGQLTKVTFPDGFGEQYTYDMLGRRSSKTQINHNGNAQDTTNYKYKGDTWVITEESNAAGEVTKSYTYDANERPLSITFKGETFWYVYNGHGDVMALTDKDGNVAARYEYDAWGVVTRMYNRYGERVREGIGWMGDLGTGNGSPGSVQGPEDDSGNIVPDYHPGNGKGNGNAKGKESKGGATTESTAPIEEESTETVTLDLSTVLTEETEPTEDITTELVKENPIRYAGYYWDRKTQYYYLQARYYDPRPARFISEDTYEGEIEQPQTLNLYAYVQNNPNSYSDPTGHCFWDACILEGVAVAALYSAAAAATVYVASKTAAALNEGGYNIWEMGAPKKAPVVNPNAIRTKPYVLQSEKGSITNKPKEKPKEIPWPLPNEDKNRKKKRLVLFHYTSQQGYQGILSSKVIRPSLKAVRPKDARDGDGQYFVDIPPFSMDARKLSTVLFASPNETNKVQYYFAIDLTGLPVKKKH
ncbi:RHS repeat-associated core domain-containing protein [Cohnella kolymensis]|uniref:RHS repeat-associated core domain-containing protein n=1 Tax=Cohnella kolymensis TaxID=1590652 RepID=UPI00069815C7|nr:RHS repeat-associated core domain-containing protein [Cohnella kolymensis]